MLVLVFKSLCINFLLDGTEPHPVYLRCFRQQMPDAGGGADSAAHSSVVVLSQD